MPGPVPDPCPCLAAGERGPVRSPVANLSCLMRPVRIACVRYLNTAPLVEGLEKARGVTLVPTVPSAIVGLLESGEADLGLASVVDAATARVPLVMLPVGMIGCDGPTLTVRVFSAVPLDRVTRLHADTDSHTSVVLARLLLGELYGATPAMLAFDARERVGAGGAARGEAEGDGWPESLLLIGDKVVTDCPPAVRYPHQLDLGEAWRRLTGLPFVYAAWMCRADRADGEDVRVAAALIDRQRRHNRSRIDRLVTDRAPDARWPLDLARGYIGGLLRYDVGPRERDAVAVFFRMAVAAGLLPGDGRTPAWAD